MKSTSIESAKNSSSFASTESAAKINLYKVDHIYYRDLEVFYIEKTNASSKAYWTPYGEGGDAHYNEVVGTLEECLTAVVAAYEDSLKEGNVIEAYLDNNWLSIEPGVGYPHYAFWALEDSDLAEAELGGAEVPVLNIESRNYRDIWAR